MPQYVALLTWTDQGIKNAKETIQRAEQVNQLLQQMGGRMTTMLWTIGQYDAISITEAPDDETAIAMALAVASQGNVRLETLKGFTAEEMAGILRKLG